MVDPLQDLGCGREPLPPLTAAGGDADRGSAWPDVGRAGAEAPRNVTGGLADLRSAACAPPTRMQCVVPSLA